MSVNLGGYKEESYEGRDREPLRPQTVWAIVIIQPDRDGNIERKKLDGSDATTRWVQLRYRVITGPDAGRSVFRSMFTVRAPVDGKERQPDFWMANRILEAHEALTGATSPTEYETIEALLAELHGKAAAIDITVSDWKGREGNDAERRVFNNVRPVSPVSKRGFGGAEWEKAKGMIPEARSAYEYTISAIPPCPSGVAGAARGGAAPAAKADDLPWLEGGEF